MSLGTRRTGRWLAAPTLVLSLAVLLLVPTVAASADDPVDEHFWFADNHYTVVEDPLPFHDAVEYCADLSFGTHLVTINSAEENQFVFDLYPDGMLGATDEEVEGDWRWVTGEPFDYTNWAVGEPNDCGGPGCPTEDYLVFAESGGSLVPEWNDVPGGSGGFVCEWEEPVVPYRVDEVTATVGDTVQFGARWLSVCNRGLTRAWTRAADLSWTMEGVPLELIGSWSDPFPMSTDSGEDDFCISHGGLWGTLWEGSLTFDEPGTYEIGQVYSVSHKVTDGGDWNDDGKPDFYGPGIIAESSVTVRIVE